MFIRVLYRIVDKYGSKLLYLVLIALYENILVNVAFVRQPFFKGYALVCQYHFLYTVGQRNPFLAAAFTLLDTGQHKQLFNEPVHTFGLTQDIVGVFF